MQTDARYGGELRIGAQTLNCILSSKKIGVGRYGNELLEYWEDDYAGQGLDRRDLFESWERARWTVDPE